nr:leucine-rich repeat domain-containing protein [Clostridia bacterium]
MKKAISVLLSLVIAFGVLGGAGISASAASSGTCGENLTWTLDDNGTLTITGTGKIESYTYWEEAMSIKTVVIGSGVTGIGDSAFADFNNLTSVTIPGSVQTIGEYAFSGCSDLFSVTVPDGVLSVGGGAFNGIANVNYAGALAGAPWGAKTLNGTIDGDLVYSDGAKQVVTACRKTAKEITVPSGVTQIADRAFYDCNELTSVTLPATVTSIGKRAFAYCQSLPSVTIPATVTSIGQEAFYECESLTSVNIPSGVTQIASDTFRECRNLTSVTIPDTVTDIGNWAFNYCSNLTSVTIPGSVQTIGENAFSYCRNLFSVTVPDGVLSVGEGAFNGVVNVNYAGALADAPWGAKTLNGTVDGDLVYSDGTKQVVAACRKTAKEITVPSGVTQIADRAFYNCENLTSVTLPATVTSIGREAFAGCTLLTSVNIPSGVTLIDYETFAECYSLENIEIPEGVQEIGESAFSGCFSLEKINIPDSVQTVGDVAFHVCAGLESVGFGKNLASVSGSAFGYCPLKEITVSGENTNFKAVNGCLINTNTKTLVIGAGNAVIPADGSVETIGVYAFGARTNLESITIPSSVKSIGEGAFFSCEGLNVLEVPSTVTAIGSYAFENVFHVKYAGAAGGSPWGAKNLNAYAEGPLLFEDSGKTKLIGCNPKATGSITIPEGVTAIADEAFSGCKLITEVIIPDSVKSIGSRAFSSCYDIFSLDVPSGVTEIGAYAFYDVNNVVYSGAAEGSPWGASNYNLYRSGDLLYSDSTMKKVVKANPFAESVVIPEGAEEIDGDAFSSVFINNLKEITIPGSVKEIADNTFVSCFKLEKVTLSPGLKVIGKNAFGSCFNLNEIIIPSGVTEIKDGAFAACANLKNVTIPLSLVTVGDGVFVDKVITDEIDEQSLNMEKLEIKYMIALGYFGEEALEYISIFESITDQVKSGDYGVKDVYYEGTEAQRAGIAVGEGNGTFTQATWHYGSLGPAAELAAAKANAKAAIDAAVPQGASDAVKAIANEAKQAIDGAADTAAVEAAKNKGLQDIAAQLEREAKQTADKDKEEAKKTEIAIRGWQSVLKVDYRSTVTFNADVTNSAGKEIIWCDKDGKK